MEIFGYSYDFPVFAPHLNYFTNGIGKPYIVNGCFI